MNEPVSNKIFFAGEALHYEYMGCAHAAFITG
jgi:hypothetical protein